MSEESDELKNWKNEAIAARKILDFIMNKAEIENGLFNISLTVDEFILVKHASEGNAHLKD
jgi:hypothetical protein